MNTLRIPLALLLATVFFAATAYSQSSLSYQGEVAYRAADSKLPETPSPYRFHKKLPVSYIGYAIEVASSTYPLDRANPVFRQFGKVHYDKLERGGYSYLILGRFSSDESALHFLNTIIVPKAKEAKLVHYKDGIRKIVRAN